MFSPGDPTVQVPGFDFLGGDGVLGSTVSHRVVVRGSSCPGSGGRCARLPGTRSHNPSSASRQIPCRRCRLGWGGRLSSQLWLHSGPRVSEAPALSSSSPSSGAPPGWGGIEKRCAWAGALGLGAVGRGSPCPQDPGSSGPARVRPRRGPPPTAALGPAPHPWLAPPTGAGGPAQPSPWYSAHL